MSINQDPFDYDVFVSYPQALDKEGWVRKLQERVKLRLAEDALEAEVFMDKIDLSVGDRLEVILPKVRRSATFLAVLSRVYFDRPWCWKEIYEFMMTSDSANALFPVLRREIRHKEISCQIKHEHPDQIEAIQEVFDLIFKDTIYLAFFHHEDNEHIYYEPDDKKFISKSDKLADNIIRILQQKRRSKYVIGQIPNAHRESRGSSTQAHKNAGICVYLAQSCKSISKYREGVKEELTQNGYTVLPNDSTIHYYYESPQTEVEKLIQQDLQRCILSVHFIGDQDGTTPRDFECSVIELQYRIVKKHLDSSHKVLRFKQFVWIPPTVLIPKNKTPRDNFYQDIQNADHFLKISFDELKTDIQSELNSNRSNRLASESSISVCLISSFEDSEDYRSLCDQLFEWGYEVRGYDLEDHNEETDQRNQKYLEKFDKVIIFWGQEGQSWIDDKLRKVNAESSKTIIFIDLSSNSRQKSVFRTRKALVVKGEGINKFEQLRHHM